MSNSKGSQGPASVDDLLHKYADVFYSRLSKSEQLSVMTAFTDHLNMASFYSGWEPTGIAARKLQSASGNSDVGAIDLFHSAECDPVPQRFIQNHPELTRPRHLFGDFTERISFEARQLTLQSVKRHHQLAITLLRSGFDKDFVKQIVEDKLYSEVWDIMQTQKIQEEQHCILCSGTCSTWDIKQEGLEIVSFGSCCYDHSAANIETDYRAGVVGDSILPWAVTGLILQVKQPHIIIEECTPRTMGMVSRLIRYLGPSYDHTTWILEPCDFGNPSTGKRRWTVYRNMARARWTASLPNPAQRFGLPTTLSSDSFFCAPADLELEQLQQARASQGFAPNDSNISWRDLLPKHCHKRLLQIIKRWQEESTYAESSDGDFPITAGSVLLQPSLSHLTVHVDQTYRYSMHRNVAGRLLRNSVPYSIAKDRQMLKTERMLQMGMPAFDKCWRELLCKETEAAVSSVAGNGFHPTVYAAVMLAVLSTYDGRDEHMSGHCSSNDFDIATSDVQQPLAHPVCA